MELIDEIMSTENIPVTALQMSHMASIIKCLGWASFLDKSEININIENAKQYINQNKDVIKCIFDKELFLLTNEDFIDYINSILIKLWHAQIVGDMHKAKLQLFNPAD